MPTTTNNSPTHTVYTIREIGQDKSNWFEIGSLWPHKDGKGFNICLDAVPVDGRLVIREKGEKKPS